MNFPKNTPQPLIMIGAGGHARVLHALAEAAGYALIGVCDPKLLDDRTTTWRGLPVIGDDVALKNYDPNECGVINGVGQLVGGTVRRLIYERIKQMGFRFPPLVHPAAWVAASVELGEGVQVMAGAVIQPDCRIGENTIVNTRAGIDHDCNISPHVHIAPGATLCGGVSIEEASFVGAGATLVQGIRVGRRAVIGAGTTLRRDLSDDAMFIGMPAADIDNKSLGRK